MTPAILTARKAGIRHQIHEYAHDPGANSFGEEAADKLGVDRRRVYKTLVVSGDRGVLAVAVVPVANLLDLKAMARTLQQKKVAMAPGPEVERVTGYVLGGVSPLGQKKALPTVIDESAGEWDTIFVSAGRRGLEIELSAADLCRLTRGQLASIATRD